MLRKQNLKRILKDYLHPETIEPFLQGKLERQPLQPGRIEYVLAFVRGDSPAEVSERVAEVADLATAHQAVVHDIVGALVVIAYGTLPPQPNSRGRFHLVEALRRQLEENIKILHAAADGHYGLFGGHTRMAYTFLVPHFDKMLGDLSRLKFGELEEFHP